MPIYIVATFLILTSNGNSFNKTTDWIPDLAQTSSKNSFVSLPLTCLDKDENVSQRFNS